MPQASTIPIGRLAAATGCKVQTIRYYEQIGLLPEPPRSAGDQRRYSPEHQSRLAFIRHARELGFPLSAIRELLRLADQQESDCAEADRIASQQLDAVRRRIALLQGLREELERMLSECRGGRIGECRVIETIANHALCAHLNHESEAAIAPEHS
jgi:Predicted transcriptional regulators